MPSFCKVLWCIFAVSLLCVHQGSANSDKECKLLLRGLLNNPPKNTNIAINLSLSKARYTCRDGLKLVGRGIRTCSNGDWVEKKEPRCLDQKCRSILKGLLKNPPKNTIIDIDVKNLKANYSCRNGLKLVGKHERTCLRGKWVEKKAPKCLVSCNEPEVIPHASYTGTNFNFKGKLMYSCEKGYKLEEPRYRRRTCGNNGKWSNAPKCIKIQCPSAKELKLTNGNVSTSDPDYYYGATLAFECNDGYELKGPDTITCLEFGWVPRRKPYCITVSCPDPGRPENGDRFGWFTVGSTVRFSCQEPFKIHGSQERTCMENKEWNGTLTTCQDGTTDCPVLGSLISGYKEGNSYNQGSIVKFRCAEGFVLKGSAVRRCMENGSWNGTEAICKDEFEDRFKDVNTTAFNLRKDVIDSLLEYTCSAENGTCNKTSVGMDTRGRAIVLNDQGGLDLVFVMDASSSVKKENFQKGLEFAKALVKLIGSSKRSGGTKLAAVTFGTEAKLEFNLGDAKVDTTEKAIKAIDEIKYMGGATASALALLVVRKVVVPQARSDSHRVLMLITDGMSNIGGPPQKEANYLKKRKHFEVYAVGVGKRVNRQELMSIASADEEDDHVIWVNKYDTLMKAVKKAVDMKIDYSPCGVSPANFRARIVGGTSSKRGMWPWQIGLYKLNDAMEMVLVCGGALIRKRWVLTAAHCFYYKNPILGRRQLEDNKDGYSVYVGDHHLLKEENSQQQIPLEDIFVHPNYKDNLFKNDIALVKLKEEVKLSKFVRTVCLPRKEEGDLAIPQKYGIATGWGVTKPLKAGESAKQKHRYSKVLQFSAFTIQSDQLCSNRSSAIAIDSDVMFCAGDGKGGNDTCHGDSGGAFVREGKRNDEYRWVATGLVSWGEGCAQKDQYGYYTRVFPFIDWIRGILDGEGKKKK